MEVLVFRQVPPFRSNNPQKVTGVKNQAKISQFFNTQKRLGEG